MCVQAREHYFYALPLLLMQHLVMYPLLGHQECGHCLYFSLCSVLPPPTDLQMEHISLAAVLLHWSYENMTTHINMSTVSVQFLVQCDRDGIGFATASGLLNVTMYTFDLLCQTTAYQFRVLAYSDGVYSIPSIPTYSFVNGVTGTYTSWLCDCTRTPGHSEHLDKKDIFCCSNYHTIFGYKADLICNCSMDYVIQRQPYLASPNLADIT